jgi:hypothetical protein
MNIGEVFNTALSSLTEPTKTANMLAKKKLTLGDGLLAIVLGALVPAVIFAVALLFFLTWFGTIFSSMPMMGVTALILPSIITAGALAVLITIPISVVIAWLIGTIVIWIVASVLGGKGSYERFASAWAFPMAVIFAVSWIPVINVLAALYAIYLLYVFLQPTMKMDQNRAAVTVIALFVLGLAVGALFGSSAAWSIPAR